MRRLAQALAVLGASLLVADASAAPRETFALVYAIERDAEGCPSEAELRASLTEAAGYDPVAEPGSSPRRSVLIEIGREKEVFRATIAETPASADSARSFHGPSCNDVVSSVVLSLAVSLDPQFTPKAPPAPPDPPPATIVYVPVYIDRPATPPPAPAPAKPPRPPYPIKGFVEGGFGVGGGYVPYVSIGPEIDLGLRGDQWEIAGGVTYQAPGDADHGSGVSATTQSVLGVLNVCGAPRVLPVFSLFACGTTLLGGSFANGNGFDSNRSTSRAALFTGGRVGGLLFPHRRVELRLAAEVTANLLPLDMYFYDGLGTDPVPIYVAPAVAGRALLSVGVPFP